LKIGKYISKSIASLIVLSILAFVGNESFFHHHNSSITIENSYSQHSDIDHDTDCLLCDLVKNFQKYYSPSTNLLTLNYSLKNNNLLKLNSFIANCSNPIQSRAPPAIKHI